MGRERESRQLGVQYRQGRRGRVTGNKTPHWRMVVLENNYFKKYMTARKSVLVNEFW